VVVEQSPWLYWLSVRGPSLLREAAWFPSLLAMYPHSSNDEVSFSHTLNLTFPSASSLCFEPEKALCCWHIMDMTQNLNSFI